MSTSPNEVTPAPPEPAKDTKLAAAAATSSSSPAPAPPAALREPDDKLVGTYHLYQLPFAWTEDVERQPHEEQPHVLIQVVREDSPSAREQPQVEMTDYAMRFYALDGSWAIYPWATLLSVHYEPADEPAE